MTADQLLAGHSLVAAFERRATQLGSRRVYTWLKADGSEEASLSYEQLRARAAAVCVALRRTWSVPEGGRVMLVYPPGLELLIAFFGCQYARIIAVPYYPPIIPTSPMPSASAWRVLAEGIAKVERIVASCLPKLLLSSTSYLRLKWLSSRLFLAGSDGPRPHWPGEWQWKSTDDLPARLSRSDREWFEGLISQHALRDGSTDLTDDVCFLQYTSGSTGQPKGVMVGTANLMANIRAIRASIGASHAMERLDGGVDGRRLCVTSWLPQYHDMGLIGACLVPVMSGWCADLLAPQTFLQRPSAWLEAISRRACTHNCCSTSPNFGYALCVRRVDDAKLTSLSLHHWLIAMNGAEPIRVDTLRAFVAKFRGVGFDPCAFSCVFGLAENCLLVCGRAETPHILSVSRDRLGIGDRAVPCSEVAADDDQVVSCAVAPGDHPSPQAHRLEVAGCYLLPSGGPVAQVVRIIDPSTSTPLEPGTIGEIWVAGDSVARGYWELPEVSERTFRAKIASPYGDGGSTMGVSAMALWPDAQQRGSRTVPDAVFEPSADMMRGSTATFAPHLRTGDLGFIWQQRLYVVGRSKDVLTMRGRTLHASDVEACAEKGSSMLRPGCCAAVALNIAGGSSEELLVLVAELRLHAPSDEEELKRVCIAVAEAVREGEGVRPDGILLLRARTILKTTSGKLRRRDCREAYLQLCGQLEDEARSGGAVEGGAQLGGDTEVPGATASLIPADAVLYHWRRGVKGTGTHQDERPLHSESDAAPLGPKGSCVQKVGGGTAEEQPAEKAGIGDAYGGGPVEADMDVHHMLALLQKAAGEVNGAPIGIDAPLMEAGLDSAALGEFQGIVTERLGMEEHFSESMLFDHPTLRQLARAIASTGTGHATALEVDSKGTPDRLAYHSASVALLSANGYFPAGVDARGLSKFCDCSTDAVSTVPLVRWPIELDRGIVAQRAKHGAFLRDAELFDNLAFAISQAEAEAMDPQQRLLLERGYEALRAAGSSRESLVGSDIGVFIGIAAADWTDVVRASHLASSVYAATGSSHSIASGRISFVLGIQGPCVSYDTACSAALVATHAAWRAQQLEECTSSLVGGVSMMLLPHVSMTFAMAGMLSPRGRCHTFDSRADGYARGEACCALTLASGAGWPPFCRAEVRQSRVRQDGRSASLTAPNGQAQRDLLTAVYAVQLGSESTMVLDGIEAHGTGTQLGDPVEVRALAAAVLRSQPPQTQFLASSLKANAGHAEPAAGLAGLIALELSLFAESQRPNAQLRVLSSHIREGMRGTACFLPVQSSHLRSHRTPTPSERTPPGKPSGVLGGVSSFGYSGTISHASIQCHRNVQRVQLTKVEYVRRRFPWRESTHPLAQIRPHITEGSCIFHSPARGALFALVSDHIVHGQVIFPAAGYLEMARECCARVLGVPWVQLRRVYFLQPLVLDGSLQDAVISCSFDENTSRFYVSNSSLPQLSNATDGGSGVSTHCTGDASGASSHVYLFEVPTVREACDITVEPEKLYSSLYSIGLEYGRSYRRLQVAWVTAAGQSLARLAPGRRMHADGTQVHPADLDAALQLASLLSPRLPTTLQLPFTVASALMRRASNNLHSQAVRQGVASAGIWICGTDAGGKEGLGVVLQSFESRSVSAGTRALARQATKRPDMYSTEWRPINLPVADERLLAQGAVMSTPSGNTGPCSQAKSLLPQGRPPCTILINGEDRAALQALASAEAALCCLRAQRSSKDAFLRMITNASLPFARTSSQPRHAGVLGLARSARSEMPTASITHLDVSEYSRAGAVAHSLALSIAPEPEVLCSQHTLLVARLVTARASTYGPVTLHFDARGAVANLRVVSQAPRTAGLQEGEVALGVRAVGLNFRDVLNVLGAYPGDPGPPGSDCAANVAELGGRDVRLRSGDSVLGHGVAALASEARTDARLVALFRHPLTFEQASTLPTTWSTVHMALLAAGPRSNEDVLLQAGAGGVGLAAAEYAHWLCARVAVSVGRPYKHFYVRSMGLSPRTLSSRDGSAFAFGGSVLLCARRVCFVLNSLSGDFIAGSLAVLGENGFFGEIGKRAVWSAERMPVASPSITYRALALDAAMEQCPCWMSGVLQTLSARATRDVAHGLPFLCFELDRSVHAAFRCLQSGRNTGKVVVRIPSTAVVSAQCTHLLTGGTGGLGLLTAIWLGENGAVKVLLSSRSGQLAKMEPSRLTGLRTCGYCVLQCDTSDTSDMRRAFGCAAADAGSRIRGLWHAAGVLSDGLLNTQTARTLRCVYAPKAYGSWTLQQASAPAVLDAFVTFSSVAALLGGAGQSNYAAANCCLDSLCCHRVVRGQAGSSVQWGPWADVGMAAGGAIHVRMQAGGIGLLSPAEGVHAWRSCLRPSGLAVCALVAVDWARFFDAFPRADIQPILDGMRQQNHTMKHLPSAPRHSQVNGISLPEIMSTLRHTIGPHVDEDSPLMDAGLDSLGAVELGNRLQQKSGLSSLPTTLVLDFPTGRQLAAYFEATASGGATQGETAEIFVQGPSEAGVRASECHAHGWSADLPAGCSTLLIIESLVRQGADAVASIPNGRWEVDSTLRESVAASHGGFLARLECFDNTAFGVSGVEAAVMDPQQRLLLEHGYAALHTAGSSRSVLLGQNIGVFVGIAAADWAEVLRASQSARSVYAATGASHSIASGRLSYFLGIHGPCASYDTACSSALVAGHAAITCVHQGVSDGALLAGVSVMLLPGVSITFARAGMLSIRGRSQSFDERADGYARSEACLAVALQPSLASLGSFNLLGGSVRQDGRGASLTAPNGQAQRLLFVSSMAQAVVEPSELRLAEAQANGTTLGDPIEVRSFASAVLRFRGVDDALVIGSIKANIGHAEPAAGLTGLAKLAFGLSMAVCTPNAQLRVLSSHVRSSLGDALCAFPTHEGRGEIESTVVSGAVNSFGYSGTIVQLLCSTRSHQSQSVWQTSWGKMSYKRRRFSLYPCRRQRRISALDTPSTASFSPNPNVALKPFQASRSSTISSELRTFVQDNFVALARRGAQPVKASETAHPESESICISPTETRKNGVVAIATDPGYEGFRHEISTILTPELPASRPELVEQMIVEELAMLLDGEQIGLDTELTSIGIDSLAAAELMSRCAASTGVTLSLSKLEAHETPRALAAYIISTMDSIPDVSGNAAGDECTNPLLRLPTWDMLDALSVVTPIRSDHIDPKRDTVFYFAGVPGVCGVEFPEVCGALPFNIVGLNCMQLIMRLGLSATMDHLASHLATTINALQATGPLRLMGFSWGACVVVATAQILEDQGREVAKLVMVEPFQRVIIDLRLVPLLAQLWIRALVPVPPLISKMHAFIKGQGADVPPLTSLNDAWMGALACHATLKQQDSTLRCETLCVVSTFRAAASNYELAENCLQVLWPPPDQPLPWYEKLRKWVVLSLVAPGTPVTRQCQRCTEVIAPGDHFFMLDPSKARPALAKIAEFFENEPSRSNNRDVKTEDPAVKVISTSDPKRRYNPVFTCLSRVTKGNNSIFRD